MKIALLHDSVLPPKTYGGIERIVMNLAYEYKRLGHEVVILSRKGSTLDDFESYELKSDFLERAPESWLPVGVDILHAHQPLPIEPTTPFLVTIHGNGHAGETYFSNTNFLSQSHARNHSSSIFIYNGVNPDLYPFEPVKEEYFVFLARASWRVKNLKTAVSIANDLKIPLHVMGGSGADSKYVKYHGMVGEKEKLPLLRKARALLYPTNWDEPCAVAPLESLACGTPVISSVNGCMPELVRPGTGLICKTYEELLEAGAKVSSIDPRECRASVENMFSVKRMADEYIKLLTKIVREGTLKQSPRYAFARESVSYLYKPTFVNRLKLQLLGKI